MTDKDLEGKVALITGAGQGVGLGTALELSAHGALVAINDINEERANAAVQTVTEAGGKAVAAVGDISKEDSVAKIVAKANELGPVDILVNNAGIPFGGMGLKSFLEETFDDWKKFVDINVYGVALMTKAVLPSMIDRGWGRVITIVSDSAKVGDPNVAVYAGTKAAGAAIMRSLAAEVGRYGVTCNSISLSSITNGNMDPEMEAKQARRYAMKRLGRPTDVAPAVAYFASPAAQWVTGQTLSVNGGYARV